MGNRGFAIVYLLVMIAVIIGVDLLFLRDDAMLRLIVNTGIVILFGVGYVLLRRRR